MTTKPDKETMVPVARNSAGLRDCLFDEIDAIRNGKSSATRANAVAKLASGIVETVRMEMDVQRYLGNSMANVEEVEKALLPRSIPLGS